MPLIANIQPISVINKTATKLSGIVTWYDLTGKNCKISWWLMDNSGKKIYEDVYSVSPTVLNSWTTNDQVLLQAIASSEGITILSFT